MDRKIIWIALAAIAAFISIERIRARSGALRELVVSLDRSVLPADGAAVAQLTVRGVDAPQVHIVQGLRSIRIGRLTAAGSTTTIRIVAGVVPGRVRLRIEKTGYIPGTVDLAIEPAPWDTYADGTPDALRLSDDRDASAFRHWFTFIAEVQAFRGMEQLPPEINDCAALIRYAYREALCDHDAQWARDVHLPLVNAGASVEKYQYPFTPLGPLLFRVKPGPFSSDDPARGAFAQFADASTLRRFNTSFVSRNLSRAEPGDLLFFHQDSGHLPDHAMIFLGHSQITPVDAAYVVYHTGPQNAYPGEIRRPTALELLNHPEPRWHPVPANPAFLGVYRWNILRDRS